MTPLMVPLGHDIPTAMTRDRFSRRCAVELEKRGVRWQGLAREHGIDLAHPERWILARHQHAFARDAELAADDPLFGWRVGEWDLRDLGLYGYAVLSASDVRSALRLLVELSNLETEAAQLSLHLRPGEAMLVQSWTPITAKSASWLHMLLCVMRQLVGPDFLPRRLGRYETNPDRTARLSDRVGMQVEGSDAPIAFLTFDDRLLDRPLASADEALAQVLRRYWLSEREELVARHDEVAQLADAVVPLLGQGTPTHATVAFALGVSTVELRRKLDRIGSDLAHIVDAVRSGLSLPLVARSDMTLVRATKALGFADPDALKSAYERWWGRPLRNGYGQPLRHG